MEGGVSPMSEPTNDPVTDSIKEQVTEVIKEQVTKITSASDYKKKFGPQIKEVILPSSAVFKIRKLQVADFLVTIAMPLGWITEEDLKTWEEKTEQERLDVLKTNAEKDPDWETNYAKTIIEHGVLVPTIKRFGADENKNELNIDELDPIDVAILSQEISKLSGFDPEFRDRVRPFRGK
jgi:hypothetical protein